MTGLHASRHPHVMFAMQTQPTMIFFSTGVCILSVLSAVFIWSIDCIVDLARLCELNSLCQITSHSKNISTVFVCSMVHNIQKVAILAPLVVS